MKPQTAEAVFAGDPEIDRIRAQAAGGPLDTHPDFKPNWGEQGDAALLLLVHSQKDAKKGKYIILPLSVAIEIAKREDLVLHVSD